MFGFSAFSEGPISATVEVAGPVAAVTRQVGAIGASAIGVYAIGRATDVTEGAVVVSDANAEIALPSLTATAATVITAVTANATVNINAPNLTTIALNVLATTGVITEVQIATISSTSLTASAGGDAFIALNPGVARATFVVTVQNEGYGNKYYINGVSQAALSLHEEGVYRFDVSDSSIGGHPFNFSETPDGTHSGGAAYTAGVTVVGTAGQPGAYVEIVVTEDTPDLYYYCGVHSGMGGGITFVTDYSQVPFAIQVSSLVPQVNFSALVEVQAAAVSLTPAEASAAGAAEAVFAELIEVGLTPFDISVTATATTSPLNLTPLQVFAPLISTAGEATASVNAPIAQVISPNAVAGFTATALANLPTIIFEPLTLQSTEYCESETTSNAVITTCEIPRFNNVVLDRIPGRYDGGRSAPYYIFNENSSVAPLFWAVDWRTFTFFGIYSDFGSGRAQRINNVVTYPNSDDIIIQVHRIAPDGTVGPVQRFEPTVNSIVSSGTSRVLIPSKRLFILGNSAKEYPYRESALNNYSTLAHQIYVPYVISDDVSFKGLGHFTINWVDGDGGSQDGIFFTNIDANFGVYAPTAFNGYLGATFNDVFYFRGHYTPSTRSSTEFNDKIHALWLFQYNGLYKVALHFGFPDNDDPEFVELYSSSSLSSAQAFFENAKNNDIVYTQDPSSEVFSFYGADDPYIEAAQQQNAQVFSPIVSQAVAISDVLSVSLTAAEVQADVIYDRTGFAELPTISVQTPETFADVEGQAQIDLPTLSVSTPQANTTLTALTGTLNFNNLRVFTPAVYETVVEIPLPTPVIQVSPPLASTNADANVSSGIASLALIAPEPQVEANGDANSEASLVTIAAPTVGTNITSKALPPGATINVITLQSTADGEIVISVTLAALETVAPEPQTAFDYKVFVGTGAATVISPITVAAIGEFTAFTNLPQVEVQPLNVDTEIDSKASVAVGELATVSPDVSVAFDFVAEVGGSQVVITSPTVSAQISVDASAAALLGLNTQPPSNNAVVTVTAEVSLPQIVVSPPVTSVSISVTTSNQQTLPITVTAPSVSISTEAGVIAPALTIIQNSIGVGVGFTTLAEPFAIRSASLSPPEVGATGGALAESALPALFTSPVRAQTSVGEIPKAFNAIFISPLEGEANGSFFANAEAGFTEQLTVTSLDGEGKETNDATARPPGAGITTVLPVFRVRGSANAEPIDLADSPILFPGDTAVGPVPASGTANVDSSVGENIVINSVAGKGQIDNLSEIDQVKLLFTSSPQSSETADANAENRIQFNPSVTIPNVSVSGGANADDNLAPGADNFAPRTTAPEVSVIINVVADDNIKIQHLETIVNRRPAVVNVTPDLTEVVTLDRSFDVTGQVPGVSNGGYLCGNGTDSSALANQYYFRVEHNSVPGTGTTLNSQDRGRLRVTLFRTQWDAVSNSFTGYEVDFLEDHTGNFYDYSVVTTQPAWHDHGDRCTALVMYKYRSSSFDTVTRYGIRKWEINYANESIRYLGESTAGVRNYNSGDGSEYGTSNTVYSAGYRGDISDPRGKTYAYVRATHTSLSYRFIALASNLTLTNTTNPGTRPSSGDDDYPTTWLNVRPDDYDQSAFRFIIIDKEVQLQALGLNIWTPLPKPRQDGFVEVSVDRLTEVVSARARGAVDQPVNVAFVPLTIEQPFLPTPKVTVFPLPFRTPDVLPAQVGIRISSNVFSVSFTGTEVIPPAPLARGGVSGQSVDPLIIRRGLPTASVGIDVFTVLKADPLPVQSPEIQPSGDGNATAAEFAEITTTNSPTADAKTVVEITDLPTISVNPDENRFAVIGDTGLLLQIPKNTVDQTAREQLTATVVAAEATLRLSVNASASVDYDLNSITPEVFAFQAQAIPDFVVLVANEVRFIEVAEELRTSVVEPETRIIEVA